MGNRRMVVSGKYIWRYAKDILVYQSLREKPTNERRQLSKSTAERSSLTSSTSFGASTESPRSPWNVSSNNPFQVYTHQQAITGEAAIGCEALRPSTPSRLAKINSTTIFAWPQKSLQTYNVSRCPKPRVILSSNLEKTCVSERV